MTLTSDWLRKLWGSQISDDLLAFEQRLGYQFRDRDLLRLALTHRSYANELQLAEQNERLEFLGDAVLGLVTAGVLYSVYSDRPEGDLSRRKSYLVSEPTLADFATRVGLGEVLRLGVGEDRSGGRDKPSLLSDALEAVFGAAYLDGGFLAAEKIIRPLLEFEIEQTHDWDHRDPKTRLQEAVQSQGAPVPRYILTQEDGPDHDKTFTVECRVSGQTVGLGEGPSKKAAEQAAAANALDDPGLLDRLQGRS